MRGETWQPLWAETRSNVRTDCPAWAGRAWGTGHFVKEGPQQLFIMAGPLLWSLRPALDHSETTGKYATDFLQWVHSATKEVQVFREDFPEPDKLPWERTEETDPCMRLSLPWAVFTR